MALTCFLTRGEEKDEKSCSIVHLNSFDNFSCTFLLRFCDVSVPAHLASYSCILVFLALSFQEPLPPTLQFKQAPTRSDPRSDR